MCKKRKKSNVSIDIITNDCFINKEFFATDLCLFVFQNKHYETEKRKKKEYKFFAEGYAKTGDGKENIRVADYAKNKVLIKDTSVVITKKEEFPKEGL